MNKHKQVNRRYISNNRKCIYVFIGVDVAVSRQAVSALKEQPDIFKMLGPNKIGQRRDTVVISKLKFLYLNIHI
jgi:hypothetical protein